MTEDTISNGRTMDGATVSLLAGRYRVVRQLGQGGMGSVWLAEDLKLDGHKVAVKMLPSILVSNKRAYNQLKAEALVSLKLTHPNIATVRAFEENDGNPFLVMDYIDGLTLDEYLAKKGKLDEETTYSLLEPVARALDYAHEKGVVHRDVKPGNVMITWDGEPFVLDFGIAREIQETLTRVTGKLSSGTLLYMSPEQLKGAAPKPAQDVYSFAAMAYECLKGEPPFARGQVEWQILNKEPEPLVGGALAASVLRGLAKDPVERPETCRGVLAASRPHVRPTFTSPRPEAEAARTADETPVNRVSPPLDFRAAFLNNKWMALVLFGLAAFVILRSVDFGSPARPSPKTGDPVTPPPGEVEKVDLRELDKTRIEAQVKVAACRRLDRGDGFGAKVEECENGLVRAKAEYELKRWGEALRDYKEVLERGARLVALDADRQRARTASAQMAQKAREAMDAQADRYAEARFNDAKQLRLEAKDLFAAMRFAEAADKHELAARQFDLSVGEAKAEAVRQKNWRQKGKPFTITDSGLALTMKWCPAGSFDMGSPEDEEGRSENEKRCHVTLTKGFWMGETEVTQGQWKKLMDGETVVDLARRGLSEETPVNDGGKWRRLRDSWRQPKDGDPNVRVGDLADDLPVYNMTWTEACAFCRRLTDLERREGRIPDGYEYRLPTEAEWEYACRAGATTTLPDGTDFHIKGKNNAPGLDAFAWYGGNSSCGFDGRGILTDEWEGKQYLGGRAFTRTVKGKKPNAWGLYDMLGNVSEWCGDLINLNGTAPASDPLGSETGRYRAVRGGSWYSRARGCRPAQRFWYDSNIRCYDLGFRIALAPRHEGYPIPETPLSDAEREAAEAEAERYHDSLVEAEKKKREADEQWKAATMTALRITADINGEDVQGAKVKITGGVLEGFEQTTPFRLSQRFSPDAVLGPFEASYEKDGQRYQGVLSAKVVDWTGEKHFSIALRPVRSSAASHAKPADELDVLLRDLGEQEPLENLRRTEKLRQVAQLKFCRHCGAKLADYSNVGTTCPACNGNLLGD